MGKRRIAEERVLEATGRSWEHWFSVLDEFDCKHKGHKASAEHLLDAHSVPMWWSQTITIEYEVAKGIREPSQRSDSLFGLSAQKTVYASRQACWEAWTKADNLVRWYSPVSEFDFRTGGGMMDGNGASWTFKRIEPGAKISASWREQDAEKESRVEIEFEDKAPSVTVRVSHTKIPDKATADRLKPLWREAMDRFASWIETGAAD